MCDELDMLPEVAVNELNSRSSMASMRLATSNRHSRGGERERDVEGDGGRDDNQGEGAIADGSR